MTYPTRLKKISSSIISLFICFILLQPSGYALRFSQTYFFGDSLTDMGSNLDLFQFGTGPVTNNNGDLWSAYLANRLNTSALARMDVSDINNGNVTLMGQPFVTTNYAVGGFNTYMESPGYLQLLNDAGFDVPTMAEAMALANDPNGEIDERAIASAIVNTPNQLDPNALYAIWIGANDVVVLDTLGFNGGFFDGYDIEFPVNNLEDKKAVLNVVANYLVTNQVNLLLAAGAKNIMVVNLPNIKNTPVGQINNNINAGLTEAFNQSLLTALSNLHQHVIHIDINGFMDEIIDNPGSFGFINTTDSLIASGGTNNIGGGGIPIAPPGTDPNQVTFYDGFHPTTRAHDYISQYIYNILRAPELMAVLPEASLSLTNLSTEHLFQYLAPLTVRPTKKFTPFFSHIYTERDLKVNDLGQVSSRHRQHQPFVGGLFHLTDYFSIGVAAHVMEHFGRFAENHGSFRTKGYRASLIASFNHPFGYAHFMAHGALLEFNDTRRTFSIGPRSYLARSSTTGRVSGVNMQMGAWLPLFNRAGSHLKIGPVVKTALTRVSVAGFDENNGGASNLSFRGQDMQEASFGAGAQIVYQQAIGNVAKLFQHLSFTRQKTIAERERTIVFNQVSLPGSHGAIDVKRNTPTFNQFVYKAGVNFKGINLMYSLNMLFRPNDERHISHLMSLSMNLD